MNRLAPLHPTASLSRNPFRSLTLAPTSQAGSAEAPGMSGSAAAPVTWNGPTVMEDCGCYRVRLCLAVTPVVETLLAPGISRPGYERYTNHNRT